MRARLRGRLRALPVESKAAFSEAISRHLLASDIVQGARCLGSFSALASEPDLAHLHAEVIRSGKVLAFPRVVPAGLEFLAPDDPTAWSIGAHGVREPDPAASRLVPPGEFDLVLVPGLGFAAGGARLGRGGGWYDRWLAGSRVSATTIGVCFSCQLEPDIPRAVHDQRVRRVVTENGWHVG